MTKLENVIKGLECCVREVRCKAIRPCLVAKKYHWEEAVCVWMGPEDTGIPAEVLAEMAQDGTC